MLNCLICELEIKIYHVIVVCSDVMAFFVYENLKVQNKFTKTWETSSKRTVFIRYERDLKFKSQNLKIWTAKKSAFSLYVLMMIYN